ncbi:MULTISPECIES: ABC-type transport auxiliary lipoprotein family protein [unclassified Halomonas]|uniref:ABC-type transport auxiliary lipoprotein family protein n=1 Tax=unclassified Halomonas TaxID=2609666 RepID=UPI00209E3056|nr:MULTISPECIES: ABC-type transport auxiliary lipoprotein family protein [unclassified Halomonas]MCP1312759.1 ABC-type transport auxiliary lipoprotein family protein [Halomonas sp. 707D7]MCP1325616.1 ABC-type transport auxiliary lipoprotein family protein [Halomonas sp. 707D4]
MKTRSLATVALALGLSGCSILPESDPATLYRLPEARLSSAASNPVLAGKRLGVATPEAGHLIGSNRIVVFPERNVVNVYEGARWHQDAPELIQSRLVDALQRSGLFESVGVDRLPSDLVLLGELRHFQSEYDRTPPVAHVQLDVQLTGPNREPLASQTFEARARAQSVEIPEVVNAFGAASDTLTDELITWLATLALPTLTSRIDD